LAWLWRASAREPRRPPPRATAKIATPIAGTYRGREEVRAYVEEWLNTFGDVRLNVEELVEVNDHVLVVVRGSGWGKASGVEVENRFCQLWTVSEGVPTRMREYPTRDEALAAAGAA